MRRRRGENSGRPLRPFGLLPSLRTPPCLPLWGFSLRGSFPIPEFLLHPPTCTHRHFLTSADAPEEGQRRDARKHRPSPRTHLHNAALLTISIAHPGHLVERHHARYRRSLYLECDGLRMERSSAGAEHPCRGKEEGRAEYCEDGSIVRLKDP